MLETVLSTNMNIVCAIVFVVANLISFNVCGQETSALQKAGQPPIGTIDGRVVNETGYPLVGAVVYVRPLNSTALGRTVLTDSDGKFVVHSLDSTLYRVWASAPAYVMPEGIA